MTKKMIAGNWKMNGSVPFTNDLVSAISTGIDSNPNLTSNCDFLICPPAPYLQTAKAKAGRYLHIGAQDCSKHKSGAYTGEVSPEMLKDLSVTHVILGHSERRQYHYESNKLVADKSITAHANDIVTIICVGEQDSDREAGKQEKIVKKQLLESLPDCATPENTIIAYEPVWAIGTGKTASADDVKAMHAFIRKTLKGKLDAYENMRILYGGSVKPANAKELFETENVDGALIGGASLKAEDYLGIAKAV